MISNFILAILWPELTRSQLAGAVLRDQLKQAAHLWEEKGRTDDLLWSGTSFREYELWRERYAGALTALEEDFARSMAGRARRRRRLARFAVAAAFVLITEIAIVIGTSRQQAVRARDQARAEAARREAAQLLFLGRLKLADSPNAALAYATASLELSDNDPARRFAVEALWLGLPALFLSDPVLPIPRSPWSSDRRWIASGSDDGTIRLWPMPDSSKPPLHTLPHEVLLGKLKSLTNLRAVRDPSSDTGWKVEISPFPGWRDVPAW